MSNQPFEIFTANAETLIDLMEFSIIVARTIPGANLDCTIISGGDSIEAVIHTPCDNLEHGQQIVDKLEYAFARHEVVVEIVGTTEVHIAWEIMSA